MVTTPGVSGRGLKALAMPKSAVCHTSEEVESLILSLRLTDFEHPFRCQKDILHLYVSSRKASVNILPFPLCALPVNDVVPV